MKNVHIELISKNIGCKMYYQFYKTNRTYLFETHLVLKYVIHFNIIDTHFVNFPNNESFMCFLLLLPLAIIYNHMSQHSYSYFFSNTPLSFKINKGN